MDEPSPAYLEALEDCKRHHLSSKTFSGSLALPHAPYIKALIQKHQVRTILDYGCGKGIQYNERDPDIGQTLEEYWEVPVTKYDPAWPGFDTKPKGVFDLVICTHVLGSIPREDIGWVVDELYAYADRVLYIGELIGPVKKNVFRAPERVLKGLKAADWVPILARDKTIEAVFAYRNSGEPGELMKFVALTNT